MGMQVIIDRFEGDCAVVEIEVGHFVNLPKELVPGAKEGDVVNITIHKEETEKRKKHVARLVNDLFID